MWWRRIHYLSLPLFALITVQVLTAGEDADHPLVLVLVGGLSAMVLLLLACDCPRSPANARPTIDAHADETVTDNAAMITAVAAVCGLAVTIATLE